MKMCFKSVAVIEQDPKEMVSIKDKFRIWMQIWEMFLVEMKFNS